MRPLLWARMGLSWTWNNRENLKAKRTLTKYQVSHFEPDDETKHIKQGEKKRGKLLKLDSQIMPTSIMFDRYPTLTIKFGKRCLHYKGSS